MKLYSLEEVLDGHFGKIGTPERDSFEKEVTDAVNAFRLGEVVRERRLDQNLTQEELAERLGVTYQSVSRWENGATYPDLELLPAIQGWGGFVLLWCVTAAVCYGLYALAVQRFERRLAKS